MRTSRLGRERGSVTAEAALVLPILVLLLSVGVGTVAAVTAQLRCIDAAREGARAAGRGEPEWAVVDLARQAAPNGAQVSVEIGADQIVVTVTSDVSIAGGLLPGVTVLGAATAIPEPTSADLDTDAGP